MTCKKIKKIPISGGVAKLVNSGESVLKVHGIFDKDFNALEVGNEEIDFQTRLYRQNGDCVGYSFNGTLEIPIEYAFTSDNEDFLDHFTGAVLNDLVDDVPGFSYVTYDKSGGVFYVYDSDGIELLEKVHIGGGVYGASGTTYSLPNLSAVADDLTVTLQVDDFVYVVTD